ncbi:MAG: efflux RND transporter periplasmic adaptor subunit [Firmicutes bacterium]|nr:efflux RND transporter periplasmic adaptor subunit [Bacillota bacterium]
MRKKLIIGGIIIIVIMVIGLVIFKPGGQRKTTGETLYDFSRVGLMDLSEKIDATGNVVLSTNSDIYPAFNATVKEIYCKAGDAVKQGQLLMTLESPQMQEQWTDAVNNINQVKLNLESAQKDLKNTQALFEIQGATRIQVEEAQNKVATYEQQLKLAQLKLDNLQIKPDNANFCDPTHRYLLIKAPFNGVIAWVNCVSGAQAQTQNSLLSIAANNALEIEAQVDESDVKLVKVGQRAIINSNDPDQPELRGVVSEVGAIGKTNAGVVNFPVRVKVSNNASNLKAGMSVDLTIIVSSYPNVLAVPASAVVRRRGRTMVAVRDKDGVSYVRVETGIQSGSNIQILSGLNPGDEIAVERPKTSATNSNNNDNNRQRGGGNMIRFGAFGR